MRLCRSLPPHVWSLPHVLRCASALLGAAMLASCASMSEDECQRANWLDRGMKDGRNGASADLIDDHRKACEKVGVQPDAELWRKGWLSGLKSFCVPYRGWQLGMDGGYYSGVCADQPQGQDFERNYDIARRLREINQQIERNYREITRLDKALREAKTDDERSKLRNQMRDLDAEQLRLRNQQQMQMMLAPR